MRFSDLITCFKRVKSPLCKTYYFDCNIIGLPFSFSCYCYHNHLSYSVCRLNGISFVFKDVITGSFYNWSFSRVLHFVLSHFVLHFSPDYSHD